MKIKVKEFHQKYPFIDPFVNLIIGAIIGGLVGHVISNATAQIPFYSMWSFWFAIVISIICLIYFKQFSVYANCKNEELKQAVNKAIADKAVTLIGQAQTLEEYTNTTEQVQKVFLDKLD